MEDIQLELIRWAKDESSKRDKEKAMRIIHVQQRHWYKFIYPKLSLGWQNEKLQNMV